MNIGLAFLFIFGASSVFAGGTDVKSFVVKVNVAKSNFIECVRVINQGLAWDQKIIKKDLVFTFDNPRKTNWNILEAEYKSVVSAMDSDLSDIVLKGNFELCKLNVLKRDLKLVDRIFHLVDNTNRFGILVKEPYYKNDSWKDLRGYLYLKKRVSENDPELQGTVSELSMATKMQLVGMCRNHGGLKKEACLKYINDYQYSSFSQMFSRMKEASEKLYQSFFEIHLWDRLSGVATWRSQSQFKMLVPFNQISLGTEKEYFWKSIAQYWNYPGFEIEQYEVKDDTDPVLTLNSIGLSYVNGSSPVEINLERRYFENQDPESAFVIAHEFGHVLGFPDCYIEIYDTEENAMIYYNLDPTNIMCARGGKVQPQHIEQLKNVYR